MYTYVVHSTRVYCHILHSSQVIGNYCVVNGGWSSWTCGSCSATCGDGTKQCSRRCDSPVPSCGGNGCFGSSIDERACSIVCCPGKIIHTS